jgi:hypothetical protein
MSLSSEKISIQNKIELRSPSRRLYTRPWPKHSTNMTNEDEEMEEWMIVLLLKKGARWGDLAVFTFAENLEILSKPSKRDPPDLVSIITTVRKPPPLALTVSPEPQTEKPPEKKKTFTDKLAQFSLKKKTSCMVQCATCSFARNTKPSEHFTEAQKAHCCILCSMTGGKKHGGHCQGISM